MIVSFSLGDALADERDQPFSIPQIPPPKFPDEETHQLAENVTREPQLIDDSTNDLNTLDNAWLNWRRRSDMSAIEMKIRPMNFHVGTSSPCSM